LALSGKPSELDSKMANLCEFSGKKLLASAGIKVPKGKLATTVDEVATAFREIGPCVLKAQVPTGKRGKSGGIRKADSLEEATNLAGSMFGMDIASHEVKQILLEEVADIATECYVAIMNDTRTKGPMLVFSTMGGMDVEEISQQDPSQMIFKPIPFGDSISREFLKETIGHLPLVSDKMLDTIQLLYQVYRSNDAELLEINPLVITSDGDIIALDCKFILDDSSIYRQEQLEGEIAPEIQTELEMRASRSGLKYIELEGNVGVIANGAGLTMTSMDAITYFGGKPANFLEIGGEAYTKSREALEILLQNPNVKSILVNFCGAFARTDVMTEGIVKAWKELEPDIPVFFSINGTGYLEAIAMVREELNLEPYDLMDDAVIKAVEAAG